MSVKSRTIDNLGPDVSTRYAKDRELFEARYIEEARLIPQKTEISVITPIALSEFNQTFSLAKTVAWALFAPPPNYPAHGAVLFSHQLIPSLGEYEKMEANEDKLESIKNLLDEEASKREKDNQQESKEEKERKSLVFLVACINRLDKDLAMINGRRNQFQRG